MSSPPETPSRCFRDRLLRFLKPWFLGFKCRLPWRGAEARPQNPDLSDVDIHSLTERECLMLPASTFAAWTPLQLDALQALHWRVLTSEQLEAVLHNPQLRPSHLQALTRAWADPGSYGRFSELLSSIAGEEQEDATLFVLGDAIEQDLSAKHAREVLLVICRSATDHQFQHLLEHMNFDFIRTLSWQELDNPNHEEFTRLATRVEQRRMENCVELVNLNQDLRSLEEAFYALVHGNPVSVVDTMRPWSRLGKERVAKFNDMVEKGLGHGEGVAQASALMEEMRQELCQQQAHLQMQNCRVKTVVELWEGTLIEHCRTHTQMMENVILPQYQVVEELTGLLSQRQSHTQLNDEESVVLADTAQQGLQLIEVMEREVQHGRKLLAQIALDRNFFQRCFSILMENVREEAQLGRFTAEFFRRCLLLGPDAAEAFNILHGEAFEELLVDHDSLMQGMKLIEALVRLQRQVEMRYRELKSALEGVRLENLKREIQGLG